MAARQKLAVLLSTLGVLMVASMAPHVAAWGRRWPRQIPGPLAANVGAPPVGVPFLTSVYGEQARISVEAAFGADLSAPPNTWVFYDISRDARFGDSGVSISPIGRSDEASTAQPAGASLQLANDSGDYTAYNPNSRWWPYVRKNTPIRVTINVTGCGADTSIRFQGEATSWTPTWDISGNLPVVTLTASGIMRRLQQGKSPRLSALYRAIVRTSPVAYWPLEDGSLVSAPTAVVGSPMLASPPTNSLIHADTGVVSGGIDGPLGGGRAADMSGGGELTGTVSGTSGAWRIGVAFKYSHSVTNLESSDVLTINTVDAGQAGWWQFAAAPGGANNWSFEHGIQGVDTFLDTASPAFDDLEWHWLEVAARDGSGTNATYSVKIDGVTIASGTNNGVIKAGSVQSVVIADSGDLDGAAHVVVWNSDATPAEDIYAAFTGHIGEDAASRIQRLCEENSIPIVIVGTSTATMGPQGTDPLPTLLREAETADGGVLYDGRGPGLTYVTRAARYNQSPALTADMAADPPQVAYPFAPVDDDQRVRNRVKADRKGGSTRTVEQSDGPLGTGTIGVYDTQTTLNVATDDVLDQHAAWGVHVGTAEGFRYPQLSLDLAATPAIGSAWLATGVGSRADVTHITDQAPQHPPDDVTLVVEGWSEKLSPLDWMASANCSPYDPWRVGVVGGTGEPLAPPERVDTGGSSLAADVDASATSLSVATPGVVWTTAAADFPVDIDVDGERMTVTAVTGASSPQTATVTRAVNGVSKAHPAGTTVKLWRPPVVAL